MTASKVTRAVTAIAGVLIRQNGVSGSVPSATFEPQELDVGDSMSLLQVNAQKVRFGRDALRDDPQPLPRSTEEALAPLPDPQPASDVPGYQDTFDDYDPDAEEQGPANGEDVKTCSLSESGCKSMCRWLKLTDKDIKTPSTGTSCPLYEWSLKTCGYVAPEKRDEGAEEDPIDCSVNIIRKSVFWPELGKMATRLDRCIQGLPSSANETCGVALALIKNEIEDLRTELALKKAANAARKNLQKASAIARVALQNKANEQEALNVLAGNLTVAENISGHYLTEDIHVARDYLDRLGPIPSVRRELEEALADGYAALNAKKLPKLNDAIVRLNISVADASEYKLNDPLPEAVQMLETLKLTRARLLEFQTTIFDGNVSLGTRTNMPQAILAVGAAIKTANISNITDGLASATKLLNRLREVNNALKDLKWATHHGRVLLESNKKGKENLEEAIRWLNTSFAYAGALSVGDDTTNIEAADTLDKLEYVYGARVALQNAIRSGQNVLAMNGSILTDDSEEVAIDLLEPAIEWGDDVGLEGGLTAARGLVTQLLSVEEAKENMTQALLEGNASIQAKAGEALAIRQLTSAVSAEKSLSVRAGLPAAKAQLELLVPRKKAKDNLALAIAAAKRSLRTRSGAQRAVNMLNRSITETNQTGLTAESYLAYEQMMRLLQSMEAVQNLTEALRKTAPAVRVNETKLNDSVPVVEFNRTGYEVRHLPYVNNSADDGDADFDEHIEALERAIARAQSLGVIDPDMEMRLAKINGLKHAYFNIRDAIVIGNQSWITKDGIDDAIEELTQAISEAADKGLVVGVKTAKKLLSLLVRIQPAMDEYDAAIAQGNISLHTVSHMGEAILRLTAAVDDHRKLHLKTEIGLDEAVSLVAKLERQKQAYVTLKASIVAGEVAIDREEGEEAAIAELNKAIKEADSVGLHRELPVAVDLLQELVHMNAEHQKMAAAVSPSL